MFLCFCVRGFRKEERDTIRVGFEDTPKPLTQYGANQDVGSKHEGFSLHADFREFRFFSRLARWISLYPA